MSNPVPSVKSRTVQGPTGRKKSLSLFLLPYAFFVFIFSVPFEQLPIGLKGISLSQIVGVGLLSVAILQPKISFRPPPLALKFFGVYLIGFIAFGLLHQNQFAGLVIKEFITLSQMLILFWISYSLLLDDEISKKGILVLGLSCVLLAVLLISGIGSEEIEGRSTIFGQNTNALAGVLVIGFLCLMGYTYGTFEKKSKMRILTMLGLGILVIGILKTGSRGGPVALTGGVLTFLLKGRTLRDKIKMMAMVSFGLGLIFFVTFENEAVRARFEETIYEGSFSGREEILPKAWEMFLERPLVGWGAVNHAYELGTRLGVHVRDTHNLFLWILNSGGIVGALPFFAGLFLCGFAAWKARRGRSGVIPMALFLAILIINLKGTGHLEKLFWFVMAYATASAYYTHKQNVKNK